MIWIASVLIPVLLGEALGEVFLFRCPVEELKQA
jgi:hypothetical protein